MHIFPEAMRWIKLNPRHEAETKTAFMPCAAGNLANVGSGDITEISTLVRRHS